MNLHQALLRLWAVGFVAVIGVLLGTTHLQAQIITEWTFETSQPHGSMGGSWFTNIAAEVGTGIASVFHTRPTYAVMTSVGNGSAAALASTNWNAADFYQFTLSTVGYSHLSLSFDVASSSNGPGKSQLQYSTDGVNFFFTGGTNTVLVNGSPNAPWNSTTYNPVYTYVYNLSSLSALDNAATVYFRLLDPSFVSAGGGTVSGMGLEWVDNVTVAVVPEPANLMGMALLALLAGRLPRRGRTNSPL